MPKKYLLYIIVTNLVVLFGMGATTSAANDTTVVDTVTVTIPISCTMSSTIDTAHSDTIANGTYKADIGTTTFKTVCNDDNGYSVYAVGYSDDTHGNTKMLNSAGDTTQDIITGTATSGNTSNWAMKLSPVAGTFAPTIENGFDNYHIVPDTYIKVATFPSMTDQTTGSSFKSTYAVNVSSTQKAGTYIGKVKYTMVHPASEAPIEPVTCDPGKICYNPNASGVADTMGDQTITSGTTSVELWASNFRRADYGFAGWKDESGTLYGPNQIIDTSTMDLTTKGLVLYANWVQSAGNLQNWSGCSSMNNGQVTALTDTRDSNVYTVAKLADGNCWMIENLRLGSTTATTLTPTDSNVASNFTLSASTNPTAWCEDDNATCFDQSMLNSDNTTNSVASMTTPDANIYSYGNYYNWYSVTAGTGTYSMTSGNATGSICPIGWRLPAEAGQNTDFYKLASTISGKTLLYHSNRWTGADAETVRSALQSYPNNFIASGAIYGFGFGSRGASGDYWSASASYMDYACELSFYSDYVYPSTYSNKSYGFAVRCMFGSAFPSTTP
ncbi:hypothetical protein IKF57_02240 [Candidatus Saccharibacteria bacterium]|nr:hypothetical protein [Candidatus Saccharibacteria bacterium]